MNDDMPSKSALVLSGGGARGAYQVGVIKALAEHLPGPIPFAAITGVSVGAINAVVLAEGTDDFPQAAKKLEGLWRSLTSHRVFRAEAPALLGRLARWSYALGFGWAGASAPTALLDVSPLAELIGREVDFRRIKRFTDDGVLGALAVTASSYTTGQSTTFFEAGPGMPEWHRMRRGGVKTPVGLDHVLASAALPGLFEARKLGTEWYGDGALRQTAPLSPAIHLGCDRLLLIAARDGVDDDLPTPMENEPYPSLGLLAGQLLDIVFNDNLDADVERLQGINGTLGQMLPERREGTDLRFLDTLMVRPSEDIRHITGDHVGEIPWAVRMILSTLGAMREPWVLPSYLTFEPGYIGALIDLGYNDANGKIDELCRFASSRRIKSAPRLAGSAAFH